MSRFLFAALFTAMAYSVPFILSFAAVSFILWNRDFSTWGIGARGVAIGAAAIMVCFETIFLEVSDVRAKAIKKILDDMEQGA